MTGWWSIVIRKTGNSTLFILDTHTSDWYFFESMDVVFDDEYIHFNAVSSDRDVVSGGAVSEWVVFSVPYEFIEKISSSSTVKIRFNGTDGRKEFDLSGGSFKAEVNEFLDYMKANNPNR